MLIRDIAIKEYQALGQLMVKAYSGLAGFPTPTEQPDYYLMLANIGEMSENPYTRVLIALEDEDSLLGGVVYLSDMAAYGSGGSATQVKNSSGIRLLAVDEAARGKGVGKALTLACIEAAKKQGSRTVILHTTTAMKIAWELYEKLGFQRAEELDFMQGQLPVLGFQLKLS